MENGAGSYRRFLDGDDKGLAELVEEYKDGLTLFLNGYVNNIVLAEELTEETFFRLITRRPRIPAKAPSNPGCMRSAGMWRWTLSGAIPGC